MAESPNEAKVGEELSLPDTAVAPEAEAPPEAESPPTLTDGCGAGVVA